ncbi:uncharacterized protein ACO6RY_07622 [Pungitius sinensis]
MASPGVHPAVLNRKTKAPLKSSKQTSVNATASKIKNKILNTSSFFKVSLKTNNKALALGLQAQKKRSRQLEMQVVCLQKQVKALCFELSAKNHKDRKLLLFFKSMHSNTVQQLDMLAELFPDSGLPKLSEENKASFRDVIKENLSVGCLTHQLPPPSVVAGHLLPEPKVPADLPENKISANVFGIPDGPRLSTDVFDNHIDAEKTHSSQLLQAPQAGTSRPSSSLSEEVERLSMLFSQSGCKNKSLPDLRKTCFSRPSEKPTPSPPDDVSLPSSSDKESQPEHGTTEERTLLLNSTMEMTRTHGADIVNVGTKAKPTGRTGKQRSKANKERACGPSVADNPEAKNLADCRATEVQSALSQACDASEDVGDPELQPAKSQSRSVAASHIPKLVKTVKSQKRLREQLEAASQDIATPDLDDYFMDPQSSKYLKWSPEKDSSEARTKVTCRTSRTKAGSASLVSRKTFGVLPPLSRETETSETRGSNLEQAKDEEDGGESAVTRPGSEPAGDKPQRKMKANSRGSNKSRCRRTFVVSAVGESSSPTAASPEAEHDVRPPTRSSGRVEVEEEPPTVALEPWGSNPRGHSGGETPRPASPDSGGPEDGLRRGPGTSGPADQDAASGAEFQTPKRARRDERSQTRKKTAAEREECGGRLNEGKKKKKSSSRGGGGFVAEDKVRRLEASPEDVPVVVPVAGPRSDHCVKGDLYEHLFGAHASGSRARAARDPKRRAKLHKPQPAAEDRRARETFVVYRRKTRAHVAPTHATACGVLRGRAWDEAGSLLADEMPPWLDSDASGEADSLLAAPGRETPRGAPAVQEPPDVAAQATPAGRVFASLTNTIQSPGSESTGRTRRGKKVVSYKEPPLNSKMRRGDRFTDIEFLSAPIFKDEKKRKKTKNKPKLETSIFVDFPTD